MSPSIFCESGNATKTRQEPFSLKFELTNFEIQESYVEIGTSGNFRRRVTFVERTSPSQIIGQSIDFPSSWCVNVRPTETHARVALKFHNFLKDGVLVRSNGRDYAVLKFRINIVDKEGDILYEKQWRSWTHPIKIFLMEDYAMVDFIALDELFDSQHFLLSDKTLRVLFEGVLYSSFMHSSISVGKYLNLQMIPRFNFPENGEYHDIQLVGESGTGFKAHQIVLGSASPVLRNLLLTINVEDHNKSMPSLLLEELSQSEISKMLEYIYTGNIKTQNWSDLKQVERLLGLGKNYELRGFRWLCYNNLINSMTLSSFLEVVRLFRKNSVEENLRASLNHFYMKNQDKLIQSKSFKIFAKEEKDTFLYVVLFGSRTRTSCRHPFYMVKVTNNVVVHAFVYCLALF